MRIVKTKQTMSPRVEGGIDAVEDAAVPGQQPSHILNFKFTLDGALHEVAELRERRREHAERDEEDEVEPLRVEVARLQQAVVDEEDAHRAERPADEPAKASDERLVRAHRRRELFGQPTPEQPPEDVRKTVCKRADDENEQNADLRIVGHMVAPVSTSRKTEG